jgi:hypothetical protein
MRGGRHAQTTISVLGQASGGRCEAAGAGCGTATTRPAALGLQAERGAGGSMMGVGMFKFESGRCEAGFGTGATTGRGAAARQLAVPVLRFVPVVVPFAAGLFWLRAGRS